MRVFVASVAFLKAAGTGYGIGLADQGDRIEFIGDWRSLQELGLAIDSSDSPQPADVEDWQVLAVNGVVRLPLSQSALAERALFVRAALARLGEKRE